MKSNAASSATADLKNEEDFADSDYDHLEDKETTHTNHGASTPRGSNYNGQRSSLLAALNPL